MKLKTFSALFLTFYGVLGLSALASYRPAGGAVAPSNDLADYGERLITQTYAEIGPEAPDASRRFAGNNLACQSCHIDAGLKPDALPLAGVFKTYPKYSSRSGRVISLDERIDECMTRSMNGRALPTTSREMFALSAYLRSIDDKKVAPLGPEAAAPQPASAERGQVIYDKVCATCHQSNGLGLRLGSAGDGRGYQFPPLWGPDSFNDGAGMDRFDRAVAYIRRNMPRGIDPAHPQLDLQEAWDVAALLQSKPRPHYQPR